MSGRSMWVCAACFSTALLASTVTGCPSAHVPEDASIDAPAPEHELFRAALAASDAECRRDLRCSVEFYVMPFHGSCRPDAEVLAEVRFRLAREPDLIVDPVALARCLSTAAGPCGTDRYWDSPEDLPQPICDDVLRRPTCGDRACSDTELCVRPEHCAAERCEERPRFGDSCTWSRCVEPSICTAVGCVECVVDSDCPDGEVCARGAVCNDPGGVGADCRRDGECQPALTCVNEFCVEPLPPGAPCPFGTGCVDGEYCSPTTMTCVPGGSLGGACEPIATWPQGTCRDVSLRCDGGRCRMSVAGDVCDPYYFHPCGETAPFCSQATRTCSPDPTGSVCLPSCPRGSVCQAGGCALTAQAGEACDERHHCQASHCVDGTCVPFVHQSEPCGPEALCPRRWTCRDGVCQAYPSLGEPCDGPCAVGWCGSSGHCELPLPGNACSDGTSPLCEHGCDPALGCLSVQTELDGWCGRAPGPLECADGMDCAPDDRYPSSTYFRCVAECAP